MPGVSRCSVTGIPLQLAWSYDQFVLFTGAKAVFPLSCRWQQRVDNAALSVYYPKYDNRIEDSYPLAASRDFSMTDAGKMAQPKVQWWLSLELNYTIPLQLLSRKCMANIMVGLYFDYCLSNLTPEHSDARSMIMLTDTRDGFPLQRLLTPVINSNRQRTCQCLQPLQFRNKSLIRHFIIQTQATQIFTFLWVHEVNVSRCLTG